MLATDKQLLLSELKQNTTSLKQKEFNLHHSNLMTVGTQAAVLAGLDIVMFIEFHPPPDSEWPPDYQWIPRCLKFFYYIMIISAFCCNISVVAHTTSLVVMAGSLALRGPDGSMMFATDGLYEERQWIYPKFGIGLALTISSCVLGVWILLHWEGALVCMMVSLLTCRILYRKFRSLQERFAFDKKQTVDFNDILHGPAAIVPIQRRSSWKDEDVQDNDHLQLMEIGNLKHRRPTSPNRSQSSLWG